MVEKNLGLIILTCLFPKIPIHVRDLRERFLKTFHIAHHYILYSIRVGVLFYGVGRNETKELYR